MVTFNSDLLTHQNNKNSNNGTVIDFPERPRIIFTKIKKILTGNWHNQLNILPMKFIKTATKISNIISNRKKINEEQSHIGKYKIENKVETKDFELNKDMHGRYVISNKAIKILLGQGFTGKLALPRVDKKGNPIKLPNIVKGEREPLIIYDLIHYENGNINIENSFFYKKKPNLLERLFSNNIGLSVMPDSFYEKLLKKRREVVRSQGKFYTLWKFMII